MLETNKTSQEEQAHSTVEKLLLKGLELKRQKKILIEKGEDWKVCVNEFASTPNGRYFLQIMVKHAQIFSVDEEINPANMVVDKGKREFYLMHVRPYLSKSNRNKIEV